MNPQTAKTKIQALLELQTLKGVKVEYEAGGTGYFYMGFNSHIAFQSYDMISEVTEVNNPYKDITAIHPIPMEPKLLEAGDRVIVNGDGLINEPGYVVAWEHGQYRIRLDNYTEVRFILPWHVIPESLLVEKEETQHNHRWFIASTIQEKNILDVFVMINCLECGAEKTSKAKFYE